MADSVQYQVIAYDSLPDSIRETIQHFVTEKEFEKYYPVSYTHLTLPTN